MTSTFDTGSGGTSGRDARDALNRETQAARDELGSAGAKLREGAQSAFSDAKERASATAEDGKSAAAGSLEDFAAAVRRASDELGDRDQSLGANLVRQAAGGLEQASDALKGRSIPELAGSVADFARRQPAAFLIGATLAGVALGRFARASSDHGRSAPGGSYRGDGQRFDGRDRSREGQGNAYTGRSASGVSFEERDRRAGTAAATSVPGTTSASSAATSSSSATGFGGASPSGGATAFSSPSAAGGYTSAGSAGANDAQLNRLGASGSTDTAKLPGHEENAR